MLDKYKNFAQLSAHESKDSYRIVSRNMGSSLALIAPHAGKIEPGTSEICCHVARDNLTYYLFEGLKPRNNSELHITSSLFDEPQGLEIAASAKLVATFHGQSGNSLFVYIGGLASYLGQTIIKQLVNSGYAAKIQPNIHLRGLDKNNICNRSRTREGVQLEISRGLRDRLVSESGQMDRFTNALRSAFRQHGL